MQIKVSLAAMVLGLGLLSLRANAKECKSDADCEEGEVCVQRSCPPCDYEDCEPCLGGGECVAEGSDGIFVYGQACATADDCPLGFRCEEQLLPCAGSEPCVCACPKDSEECDCACREPEPCSPTFAKVCVWEPKHCASDSDCDPGFECKEIEECSGGGCSCSGCVCAPCAPDTECLPCDCPDIECDCPDVFEVRCDVVGAWCAPKEQVCDSDADCLEGWECVEAPGACACPPCECLEVVCTPDGSCEPNPDCKCDPCDCESTKKICLPQGWYDAGFSVGAASPEAAFSNGGSGGERDTLGQEPPAAPSATSGSKGCQAGAQSHLTLGFLLLLLLIFRAFAYARRSS